jgi:transcriptional regulator with XRE-family HTH domain
VPKLAASKPVHSSIEVALASLPYDPMVRFGQHVAALRRAQGMSQESLALDSGLARSYLGGVERGQRNIALVNICRLAQALGLPPARLLEFDTAAGVSKRRSGSK